MQFEKINEVTSFESGYGIEGVIQVVITKCDVCGETKKCIYIDGSEGEYGGGAVCLDCTIKAISDA